MHYDKVESDFTAINEFLQEKLKVMEEYVNETQKTSAVDVLSVAIIKEAKDVIQRQMEKTHFLKSKETSEETAMRLMNSPMTNSSYESRIAAAENLMASSGGNA